MNKFTYDAPDFVNFENLEDEDVGTVEAFFDKNNHDNGILSLALAEEDIDLGQKFYTPMKVTPEKSEQPLQNKLRKSLSMGQLPLDNEDVDEIRNAMQSLTVSSARKSRKSTMPRKSHGMTLRDKLVLRTRSIPRTLSKDHLDKLALPKNTRNASQDELVQQEYVSMAEAVKKFHQKTPKRFHSTSKHNLMPLSKARPNVPTIPQSPALATKQRSRRTQIMSTEDKELKDFEEARKFQIKANPVNKRILNAPAQIKPLNLTKKVTQPEPFKLTEVTFKKPLNVKQEKFEFHAKPVPKSLFQAPKPVIKQTMLTNPVTPSLLKRYSVLPVPVKNANETKSTQQPVKALCTKTVPMPFSFEQRSKEIFKKREQLANEALEQQKKAREFHARPAPKRIFMSPQPKKQPSCQVPKRQRSASSLKNSSDAVNETNNAAPFKARPAKVLQQKPFEPKKAHHHIDIAAFELHSDKRAEERKEFEKKLKEKQECVNLQNKMREEQIIQQEEENRARLRRETVYKAKPIRRYRDIQPVPVKELTDPVSPSFVSKSKNDTFNKENVINMANGL